MFSKHLIGFVLGFIFGLVSFLQLMVDAFPTSMMLYSGAVISGLVYGFAIYGVTKFVQSYVKFLVDRSR